MAFFWGLNYPLVKIALQYQSFATLTLFRVLFAIVFSFAIFWKKIRFPKDKTDNFNIFVFAILNIVIFFTLWFMGESTVSSGLSSIIIYTYPILSILFSFLFLKEGLNNYKIAGLIFGFIGLVLIFANQIITRPNIGLVFLIIAAISWSFGIVFLRKYLTLVGSYTVNSLQFLYALPLVFIISIPYHVVNVSKFNIEFLLITLYMGSLGTAVAYFIFVHLYSKYKASEISGFFFLVPAISLILGYFILGETMSLITYIGFAVIGIGIYLTSVNSTKKEIGHKIT
jgi:drug/metabolite transporter (DMT)-like permease